MRWAHFSFVLVATGAVACTALLGDFTVGGAGPDTDGGNDAPNGNGEGGVVTITPPDAKMGILRSQSFTAPEPVTWSLKEGAAAGAIDANGVYISGPTPATYHVIATAKADPSRTATVPIVVTNLAVAVLLGQNGGQGNIDGVAAKAHFNSPQGIAHFYENGGNSYEQFYIADTGNHAIRFYDGKTGNVTTVAGASGTSGTADGTGAKALFSEPRDLAIDSVAKKLYVVDHNGTCIRAVDLTSYAVTTIAGVCGTSGNSDGTGGAVPVPAMLQNVASMAISGDKHTALYVCDGSFRMRRIELLAAATKGTAQDMLAGGAAGSCGPLTVDYFSGGFFNKVVYFNDNRTLKKFTEPPTYPVTAAMITTVATIPDSPSGMGVYYDDLYATSQNTSVIYHVKGVENGMLPLTFDATPYAGALSDRRVVDGTLAASRFGSPSQIDVFTEYGELLIADQQADAIRRIRTSQGVVDSPVGAAHITDRIDGPRTTARITGPFSVASDDKGIVYFGDINFDSSTILNSTIRKFDRTAAVASTLSGVPTRPFDATTPPVDGPHDQARFWFPVDMTYSKGKLYVVDNAAQAVRGIDTATGDVKTIAGELTVPGNSDGIGVAAHFKFVESASGSGSGGAGFLAGSVTTDGTNLYVTDSANFAIRKIVISTGETSTIAGGTQGPTNGVGKAAQFVLPIGITYDAGSLYIADWNDHTIRRMNLATGTVDGFIGLSGQAGDQDGDAATATLNAPFRVVADGLGNLYVAELPVSQQGQPAGVIRRVDIKNRSIKAFAGTPGKVGLQQGQLPSTLNCPTALTIMPKKDLVFGDFCDTSIAIFQPL